VSIIKRSCHLVYFDRFV